MIEPSSIKLLSNSTTIADKFQASFQTSANGTSYRLMVYVASTSALAYVVKFDNISMSPSSYLFGTPVTDWQSFTSGGTWAGGTTYVGKYRRFGDSLQAQVTLTFSSAPTGTNLYLNLPSGLSIDPNKKTSNGAAATTANILGTGKTYNGGSNVTNITTTYVSSTQVGLAFENTAAGQLANVTPTTPFTYAAGSLIDVEFTVPITGWSSSVQMSEQADTRVVAASYTTLSSTSYTAPTAVKHTTKLYDTHNAYNTATGEYTCPVPGFYQLTVSASYTTSAIANWSVYKNGVSTLPDFAQNDVSRRVNGKATIQCNAGDKLTVVLNVNNVFGDTSGQIYIERVGGPAQIAATETIVASYRTGAGQSFVHATEATVLFGTKMDDTHNIYNTSTGVATIPAAGRYTIEASLLWNGATGVSDRYVGIRRNGVPLRFVLDPAPVAGLRKAVAVTWTGTLNAGDLITITGTQTSGAALTLFADPEYIQFSLQRIGN